MTPAVWILPTPAFLSPVYQLSVFHSVSPKNLTNLSINQSLSLDLKKMHDFQMKLKFEERKWNVVSYKYVTGDHSFMHGCYLI